METNTQRFIINLLGRGRHDSTAKTFTAIPIKIGKESPGPLLKTSPHGNGAHWPLTMPPARPLAFHRPKSHP
ncbi:fibulin-2 isoform x1 [Lasius niger]|uniref:Fibulin-2 isoform x1 n=1 Tax=Lasius niger TaxID=67767 RepID=A0A0J7L145_LASNI|nr:fibulin-2 isoform x1 [Lasius niger]